MRDTELYRQMLGLEAPWEVTRVELSVDRAKVDVWADHSRGVRMACPECGRELAVYDHGEEREWRQAKLLKTPVGAEIKRVVRPTLTRKGKRPTGGGAAYSLPTLRARRSSSLISLPMSATAPSTTL
jgi:hypothetical protein